MSNSSDVIYLVSCAVNNVIPDRSRVEKMDLDEVYRVAPGELLPIIPLPLDAHKFFCDKGIIKDV